MKMYVFSILTTIFVCLAAWAPICGQTTGFTYQGSLKDGSNPANGNYDFEFALFDTLSGGSQIGPTLTQSSVTVTDGVFSVSLDFGSQFPGASRFLDIKVRATGQPAFTPLNPRHLIHRAPYSIKSLSADSALTAINATQLGGVSASQFVQTNDSRLTDARSPLAGNASYIQNQDAGPQASSSFNISGNGTAGGTLGGNIVNAATQFNLGGDRMFWAPGTQNLFAGISAGQSNTGGSNNAFFGSSAGLSNTDGSSNSFFGRFAGRANTLGNSNAFFGTAAGELNTTGNLNSFFGAFAGQNNSTGENNSFFGNAAGFTNTTGESNSFFGSSAGLSNTTGISNAFFGRSAGQANTTGANNAFFGRSAGAANLTGNFNSFFGSSTGSANTSGHSNSFFGHSAGGQNLTGESNSFFGRLAGQQNTTGSFNSFFGRSSGQLNTSGSNNAFYGYSAGANNSTGSSNAFFGESAGLTNNIGTQNAFFGRSAGMVNTSGSFNSIFGSTAGGANTVGNYNSFFGYFSGHASTGDLNSFFGNQSGRLNTTGSSNAFFGSMAGETNTTGGSNSFFGAGSGVGTTIGSFNAFFGNGAGNANVTGDRLTILGSGANVGAAGLSFATAIGAGATVNASNTLVLGRGTDTVQVPGAANVTGALSVGGAFTFSGSLNGSGAGLTSLNANNITTGVLAPTRGGTGPAGATGTFLRSDGTNWASSPIVAGDIPSLSSGLTGVLPIGNGGTGLNAVGASNTFLRSNGTAWTTGVLATSDIPSLAASYIQNGGAAQAGAQFNIGGNGTIGGTLAVTGNSTFGGNLEITGALTAGSFTLPSTITGVLAPANGGTGAPGASGTFLRSNGATWSSSAIQASDIPSLATNYIQNQSTLQTGNFNVSGNGTVGGTFTGDILRANTQFNLGTNPFLRGGSGNFFAGVNSGGANTTGEANTFVGTEAGETNTVGSNNTILGKNADVASNNLNYATAVGSDAVVSTSNTVVLGRGDDAVKVPGTFDVTGAATFGGNLNVTGTLTAGSLSVPATSITGILPVGSGGTGSSDAATSGNYLRGNGTFWTGSALLASDISGQVSAANGGTGLNGTGTSTNFLRGNGTGGFSLGNIAAADLPSISSGLSGVLPIANGGTGLNSVGSSNTFLRSDGTAWTTGLLTASDIPSLAASYIQNGGTAQAGAQFNIGGNGTVGGDLTVAGALNATLAASSITGVLGTGNGGTGAAGANGTFLRSNGTAWASSAIQASDIPSLAGSYIQNGTTAQAGDFNVLGNGTVGGTFTGDIVRANTQFNLGANRFLSGTGTSNFFAGVGSGSGNTTGESNSFVGTDAGKTNTVGSNNTTLGKNADIASNNLNYATAIGSDAVVSTSNTVVLGRTADAVKVPGAFDVTGAATVGGDLNVTGTLTAGNLSVPATSITGILPVENGGTGSSATATGGNYLRGNGTIWTGSALLASDLSGQVSATNGGTGLNGTGTSTNFLRGNSTGGFTLGTIAAGDLPSISSGLTGVLPIDNGGTGLNAVGANNTFLRSNGTAWTTGVLASSDIPSLAASYIQNGATAQAGAQFNIGGNGTIGGTLNVTGNSSFGNDLAVTGALTAGSFTLPSTITGSLGIANGGTGLNAVGANNTFLRSNGTAWTTGVLAASDIPSLATGMTGVLPMVNGGTGVAAAGSAGNVLRSDGTNWTSSALQASDIPSGSGNYVQNTTTEQAGVNFNVGGNGTIGGNLNTTGTVTADKVLLNGTPGIGGAGAVQLCWNPTTKEITNSAESRPSGEARTGDSILQNTVKEQQSQITSLQKENDEQKAENKRIQSQLDALTRLFCKSNPAEAICKEKP